MSQLNLNDGQFRENIDGVEHGKTSQVTGMNRILNFIQGNCNFLKGLVDKKANSSTKINAGKGLTGGGDLSADRTIDVGASDDSITVDANGIKVNTYDNVNSTSTTRPASAGAVKKAYDKANTAQETADNKLNKGPYQGDAQDLKDEIDGKQSKIDNSLETNSKEITGAINELDRGFKKSTVTSISDSSNIHTISPVDTRNINSPPVEYGTGLRLELKYASTVNLQADQNYIRLLSINAWNDGSGGGLDQIAFSKEQINIRHGFNDEGETWGAWKEVYTTQSVKSWKSEDGLSGWVKYPDGRLEQWGWANNLASEEKRIVILPIAFKNNNYNVVATQSVRSTDSSTGDNSPQVFDYQSSKFTLYSNEASTNRYEMSYSWYAIGWWK